MMQYLGVFLAGFAFYALGALWYSPVMFSKPWMKLLHLTPAQIQKNSKKSGVVMTYLTTFFCHMAAAFTMNMVMDQFGIKGAGSGLLLGATLAVGLVAMTQFPNYLFSQKPKKLFLIDSGYNVTGVILVGIILGYFRSLI